MYFSHFYFVMKSLFLFLQELHVFFILTRAGSCFARLYLKYYTACSQWNWDAVSFRLTGLWNVCVHVLLNTLTHILMKCQMEGCQHYYTSLKLITCPTGSLADPLDWVTASSSVQRELKSTSPDTDTHTGTYTGIYTGIHTGIQTHFLTIWVHFDKQIQTHCLRSPPG